jgi:hypothetical protein
VVSPSGTSVRFRSRNERTGVPLDARPSIRQARSVAHSDHARATGPLDVAAVVHAVKVFRQEILADFRRLEFSLIAWGAVPGLVGLGRVGVLRWVRCRVGGSVWSGSAFRVGWGW